MEVFAIKLLVTETAKMGGYIYLRFLSMEEKITPDKMFLQLNRCAVPCVCVFFSFPPTRHSAKSLLFMLFAH